jgi:hypothetical protein
MTRDSESDNLSQLYDALLPALTKAAVGDYSGEVDVSVSSNRRVAELLVGVQVLLDVINEKTTALERAKAGISETRDHSATLLEEVLKNSIE